MLKRALLAVTMVVASTTMATTIDLEPGTASASDTAACHSAAPADAGCALRIAEPSGESALPSADPATLAPTSPALEPAPPRDTGLDFKDAATDSVSVLHASLDLDTSHPLIPALLSLGALVVLLRKRPF